MGSVDDVVGDWNITKVTYTEGDMITEQDWPYTYEIEDYGCYYLYSGSGVFEAGDGGQLRFDFLSDCGMGYEDTLVHPFQGTDLPDGGFTLTFTSGLADRTCTYDGQTMTCFAGSGEMTITTVLEPQ